MRELDDELGGEGLDATGVEHHGPHWEHRRDDNDREGGSITSRVQATVRVSVVVSVEATVVVTTG